MWDMRKNMFGTGVFALAVTLAALALSRPALAAADSATTQPPGDATVSSTACPAKPLDTAIHVKLVMPEPKIDHTQSRYDLQDFNVSTKSPYGEGRFTHVNGLMRGPVELSTQMTVAWQTDAIKKENCFWYRAINLKLKLDPTIYVAKEIKADNCYYNAIIEHEMKHVEVDRGIVRDYQNVVYDTIENYVQHNGLIDHVPLGQEKDAQKQLAKELENQIRDLHKRLRNERIQRQAQVDTLSEYNRVASECGVEDMLPPTR